jgi:hypothetical protein
MLVPLSTDKTWENTIEAGAFPVKGKMKRLKKKVPMNTRENVEGIVQWSLCIKVARGNTRKRADVASTIMTGRTLAQ